jgi:hypothetical protein
MTGSGGTDMSEIETKSDAGAGPAREGGFVEIARTKVELWLVVIFMALAFGAGIAVMVMYEEPQPVVGVLQPAGQFPQAPPLTDEEIQGGLPTGHPDLGGATGATGAAGVTGTEQASGSAKGDGATGSG